MKIKVNERKEKALNYIRKNLLTVGTIIVVVMMAVVIGRNTIHAVSIGFEIGKLSQQRDKYQHAISRDSMLLEGLNNDAELERYARETYFMQNPNEEIFIIE